MGHGNGKAPRAELSPPGSTVHVPMGVRTSTRCRATHDVPWTERCVLGAEHAWAPIRQSIVQSGEHAGASVAVWESHRDKAGRTWPIEGTEPEK